MFPATKDYIQKEYTVNRNAYRLVNLKGYKNYRK